MDALQFLGLRKRSYDEWKRPEMAMLLMDLIDYAHLRKGENLGIGGNDRDIFLMLGRQQVVWRILNHLHMSEADLYELYNRSR